MNHGTDKKAKNRFKNLIANKSDKANNIFSIDENREFSLSFHEKSFSNVRF